MKIVINFMYFGTVLLQNLLRTAIKSIPLWDATIEANKKQQLIKEIEESEVKK